MDEIWDIGNYRFNTGPAPWDQGAVKELLEKKYKNSPHIKVLIARKLQSFLVFFEKEDMGEYKFWGLWQPGDFAAHMVGAIPYNKSFIFEQLIKNSSEYPSLPPHLIHKFAIKQ